MQNSIKQMDRRKCFYCIIWSAGLLTTSLYNMWCKGIGAFDFSGKKLADATGDYIFPMTMAMTLYLIDVIYNVTKPNFNTPKQTVWILISLVLFMVLFVTSLMVSPDYLSFILCIMSWLSLTLLKFKTTEGYNKIPYRISDR